MPARLEPRLEAVVPAARRAQGRRPRAPRQEGQRRRLRLLPVAKPACFFRRAKKKTRVDTPRSKPVVDPATGAVRLYYFGGDGPHFGPRNSTLLLATLPPDGFAGLAAGGTARRITTHPLRCGGRAPALTATVAGRGGRGGGRIRARVLRADGKTPVKGLGFDASKPVLRDAVDEPLAWRPSVGAAPVPEVCVLQFEIRDAVLYTFGFAATQRAPAAPAPPPGEWVALRRLALGVLRLWTVLAATTLSALAARSAAARACACLGSTRRKAGGAS